MFGKPTTQAAESFAPPLEDPGYIRFGDGTPGGETEEDNAKFMKQWHVLNQAAQADDMRSSEKFLNPPEDPNYPNRQEAKTHEFDGEEDEEDIKAEEDETVDESVREDMNKLESTFKGISKRYRLINRIGEGE